MDKFKSVAKGGWHPSGDKSIHRETWKSDLKGIATGKKTDPYEAARNHQSTPLTSLKDPDSFGPPPKQIPNSHSDTPSQALSTYNRPAIYSRPAATSGGLGARVPAPAPRQTEQEVEVAKPAVPYRTDTTGLRTDNLPKPPTRSVVGGTSSPQTASPVSLPPRQSPVSLPPRQTTGVISAPPPVLPPRQSSALTEHTTSTPPAYVAAQANRATGLASANEQAAAALARAGISATTQSNRNAAPPPAYQQQAASNLARAGLSAAAANPQATSNLARAGLSAAAANPQASSNLARAGLTAAAANPQAASSIARAGLAATQSNRNTPLIPTNPQTQQSASNLARAGISVPALGIETTAGGSAARPAAGGSQVNELQQRFAKMNTGAPASPVSPVSTNFVAAAQQKKPAPPPPPKKSVLQTGDVAAPPPIPLGSKPRP